MSRRRRIAAFLLSPAVGAGVFILVWVVSLSSAVNVSSASKEQPEVPWTVLLQFSAVAFGVPLLIGYMAEIVLGWPLLIALRRRKRLSAVYFAAGGLLIGLIIDLVLYWDDPAIVPGVPFCVIPAVTAALFFGWLGDWECASNAAVDD